MRLLTAVLLAGATLAVGTPPLLGQATPPRSGFWFGGGLGLGLGSARCEVCAGNRDSDLSGYAGFGGTLTPGLKLGVEGNGWRTAEENIDVNIGSLSAVAYWYPAPRGAPWYLKGGFGIVAYRADDDSEEDNAITARSVGGQFGVGYDIHVARSVAFTPFFNFVGSLFADLESEGERLVDASVALIQVGIGLTFH